MMSRIGLGTSRDFTIDIAPLAPRQHHRSLKLHSKPAFIQSIPIPDLLPSLGSPHKPSGFIVSRMSLSSHRSRPITLLLLLATRLTTTSPGTNDAFSSWFRREAATLALYSLSKWSVGPRPCASSYYASMVVAFLFPSLLSLQVQEQV